MNARGAGPALIVAGLSARIVAEAAARDGHAVWSLDVFGDADTRAASRSWQAIASSDDPLRLDPTRVIEGLRAARDAIAVQGLECLGWIPTGGLEGLPQVIDAGSKLVPLLGTSAQAVRALRDPRDFFASLDAWSIGHPEVRFEAPSSLQGWLWKDANGCGGTHIVRGIEASTAPPSASGYWQRERDGKPLSATLLCNGRDAAVLGLNRQIVHGVGRFPFEFRGLVGGCAASARVSVAVQAIASRLARHHALRGWCSLDLILDPDGETLEVLELNPRPPASLAVYGRDGGVVTAHLQACVQGLLPDAARLAGWRGPVRQAFEILHARRPLALDAAARAALEAVPELRDRPWAHGSEVLRFPAGAPVCTVHVEASPGDADDALLTRLTEVRDSVLNALETLT